MKDVELRLISELIKSSRRSDRELAKALGVSQPTVSRMRVRLEKEGLLEYTAIPDLAKLGLEILAVSIGKRDYPRPPEIALQEAKDFAKKHPNIIFASAGMGIRSDWIAISVHKDYSDYAKLRRELSSEVEGFVITDAFLISLTGKDVLRPLSFRYIVDYLKKEKELE